MSSENKAIRLIKQINIRNIKRTTNYIKNNGLRGLKRRILSAAVDPLHYNDWFQRHKVAQEELERQRKVETQLSYRPLISIVVPMYETKPQALRQLLVSVREQTYTNWQLCLADGSRQQDREREELLASFQQADARVCYKKLSVNGGISENTNEAIRMAKGSYLAFLDHDDFLEESALFEIVSCLQHCDADVIYTDEDKFDETRSEYMEPNLKPDFSPDLLMAYNYITHFFVVKRTLADQVGLLDRSYDGAQDYDFIWRCVEAANMVLHVPKVLYHWRICKGSTADDPKSKQYCYDAGQKAIEAHLKRQNIRGTVTQVGLPGMYHTTYEVQGNPLVSVIIPNKDHLEDLTACIASIEEKSIYRNLEFIVVENNSKEEATFAGYEQLQKSWENVQVVTWKGEFNFAAINNFGIRHAKGDYYLFLNNDVTMISPDAIAQMLGLCMRSDVGIVGARLLFPNDRIQHAGIVIGFGGFAGHVFVDLPATEYGYMRRARVNCDYSAVTAACLMAKAAVVEEIGGFTEDFAVALNDVDFCLKVRKLGLLVVYNAFSEWYHYESKSRGYEDTPEKKERFEAEIARFQERWKDILNEGDPYYNPNFPLNLAPFTLD